MPGRRLALLISASAVEIEGLRSALADAETGRFDVLPLLLDESAARMRSAIGQFFSSGEAEDFLLLHYSGNCLADDEGRAYLAAKETARGALASTALPVSFVAEAMHASAAHEQVVILDCRHAADAALAMGVKVASAGSGGGGAGGSVALTAGHAVVAAPWGAGGGTFTRRLAEGLQTGDADLDGDGRITLEECFSYVSELVASDTPAERPRLFRGRGAGEIVLGWNRKVKAEAESGPRVIESVSFPREVRPKSPGEIRVRFRPETEFARIVFRYDATRLQVTGKDLVKSAEFEHLFAPDGPRETRYALKAKEVGSPGREQIDLDVYDHGGNLLEPPRSEFVSVAPDRWWRSLQAKITTTAVLAVLGWLGAHIPWQNLPGVRSAQAYQGSFTEDFVNADAWLIRPPKGRHTLERWPHYDSGAIQLTGDVTMLLSNKLLDAGSGFFGAHHVLQDFVLALEFEIPRGNELGLLVHAQQEANGSFQKGYLFRLRLNDNPAVPGSRYLSLDMSYPRAEFPANGMTPLARRQPQDGSAPAIPLKPTDWFTLYCRVQGAKVEFAIKVHPKDPGETKCRTGLQQWLPFNPFTTPDSQGGSIGIHVAQGNQVLLNDLRLNQDAWAPEEPQQQEGACASPVI